MLSRHSTIPFLMYVPDRDELQPCAHFFIFIPCCHLEEVDDLHTASAGSCTMGPKCPSCPNLHNHITQVCLSKAFFLTQESLSNTEEGQVSSVA